MAEMGSLSTGFAGLASRLMSASLQKRHSFDRRFGEGKTGRVKQKRDHPPITHEQPRAPSQSPTVCSRKHRKRQGRHSILGNAYLQLIVSAYQLPASALASACDLLTLRIFRFIFDQPRSSHMIHWQAALDQALAHVFQSFVDGWPSEILVDRGLLTRLAPSAI